MAVQRPQPICHLIRANRRHRGGTQYTFATALARASGNSSITREQVARWERGKRIPGPYWRRWIAEVLDLPRDQVERSALAARRLRLVAGSRQHTDDARSEEPAGRTTGSGNWPPAERDGSIHNGDVA